MKIQISPEVRIQDVQKQFSGLFPYLKIEFFTKPHEIGEGSWSKFMIFDRHKALGDIATYTQMEGDIEFSEETTVAVFEQTMQSRFGLPIQVFRKSMSAWLETTTSDNMRLAHINAVSEASAHTFAEMIFEKDAED